MSTIAIKTEQTRDSQLIHIGADSQSTFGDKYAMTNNGGKLLKKAFKDKYGQHTLILAHSGKSRNFDFCVNFIDDTLFSLAFHTSGEGFNCPAHLEWDRMENVYEFFKRVNSKARKLDEKDEEINVANSSFLLVYKYVGDSGEHKMLHGWKFNNWGIKEIDGFMSFGSGSKYALALLEVGYDVRKAIEVARKLDASTGGDIQVESLSLHKNEGVA